TNQSTFLVNNMETPTAFESSRLLFRGTVKSLQYPRPKRCWGIVVYLPHFFNNKAARSGGALYSSHPEALSMVCDEHVDNASSLPVLMPNYADFNESALAEQVLMAMKKASYQVLDNRIVLSCYREEIERIFKTSFDRLSNVDLSTLDIFRNRAGGYGYLIAIVPSKIQVLSVSWSAAAGSNSNVASNDTRQGQQVASLHRRQLSDTRSNSSSGSQIPQSYLLSDNPFFRVMPGTVFDNDTQSNRTVRNHHITANSNKPMDMAIQLLDALDQVTWENTTVRQAQVRARLLDPSNNCTAELLGGYEGAARNGTAVIPGIRLRALKGENYSIEIRVVDAMIQGTVELLVVNITVPPCSIGEVPRDGGYLCQKCDQRTFSLWQDTEELRNCTYDHLDDIVCYPCPDGGECLGGAVLLPSPGFWHSAANSTFMNACPNPVACRDGDDEAQAVLVACQKWWYSRPAGFDYQGFADSVLSGNKSTWLASIRAAEGPNDAATDAAAAIDLTDPSLCVLWGLPYDHPTSYMQKQCANGYKGRLCAICSSDDGVIRASDGDFGCNECYSRRTSITVAVLGFAANVITVLFTVIVTFMTDYTENEDMGIGDLLRVFIVHMQFFIIVTRININWPTSISNITSLMSAFTGVIAKVYAPSCMLDASATPEDVATITQLVAIISPLLTILFVVVLWMIIRMLLFNFKNATRTEQKLDMRTINEYKIDRVRRLAVKRQDDGPDGLATSKSLESPYGMYGYGYDAYTDLRATDLLTSATQDQVAAGGAATSTTNNNLLNEGVTPLDLPIVLDPLKIGSTYGNQVGAEQSSVHIALPVQEGLMEEELEPNPEVAFREDEQDQQQQQQQGGSSLPRRKQKLPTGSYEEAKLSEDATRPPRPTQTAATGMAETATAAAAVVPEEKEEKERDSLNDDSMYPGRAATHAPKPLLPLPPWLNEMPAVAVLKTELPPPPPPTAPPPPPPAPTPPQPSDANLPPRDGVEDVGSGSSVHASLPAGPESFPSQVTREMIPASVVGSTVEVPAPTKSRFSTGRSKYANFVVRPILLASFREGDTVQTGSTASDGVGGGAGTGGGTSQPESSREGNMASGIAGNGSQSPSEYLRLKLSEGSTWVRNFFTYDEEAAPLEGQVRWASLANIHRTMAWWRQELLVVMIACFVLYPAWAQATLQIFACYYLDDGSGYYPEYQLATWGKGYWILNMNQECYLGNHARIWVPIGIVCIFIICAGIPLLTFMATWTHRTALGTVHVVQTYGFLYRRYDYETFYWWESAMQIQTLLLVVVDVFGRILAVYQQAVLLMLVLTAIMSANMYFQPLKHKVLERMSNLSLAVLSFTVALGLFFVPPADRKDPVTSTATKGIGAVIVVLNAGLLLYFVLVMWTHGREALNRKVAAAKQRVAMAGSKVHMGTQKVLRAIRHRVSSASQNLHSMSIQKVYSKLSRRGSTPPVSPAGDY
ncbi:hypothetical protein Vretifemale_16001, partial [Volvox reticuliferus]